ncbi:MAG: hypothetical protein ACI8R9_001222 [Paraglaciecola sp.]|jgi:uncharacterized protein YbaP (TraB family)
MDLISRIALLLLLLLSGNLHAASVWKVTSDEHSLYIGGTIHILAPEDYPLPKQYQQAFALASTIVFETDMQAVNSVEFQQQMMAAMSYKNDRSLSDDLSPEIYAALVAHLSRRGMSIAQLSTLKPGLVAIMLSMMELRTLGFTSIGVDQFYANAATKQGKQQRWLESPAQQLAFLANLGLGDEDALIEYSLRDIKTMPQMMGELRSSWRDGDVDKMTQLSIVPFKADYPQIYQDLLVTRNNDWLPQIQRMLNDAPVELILVGSLHLTGPDSVLAKLTANGYGVEKL